MKKCRIMVNIWRKFLWGGFTGGIFDMRIEGGDSCAEDWGLGIFVGIEGENFCEEDWGREFLLWGLREGNYENK